MKPIVEIFDYDETHIQMISEDRGVLEELLEFFTYDVPNAKFMPKYKAKLWDGKYRLFDTRTYRLYKGLIPYVIRFCADRGYECSIDSSIKEDMINSVSEEEIDNLIKSYNLKFVPYDFQKLAFSHCIRYNRATLLSPTSSGKSLYIYMMIRYYLEHTDGKLLITVPTIDLVSQLLEEWKEYCKDFDIESISHTIHGGKEKTTDKRVIISTWQSVYEQPRHYFEDIDFVMVDEAHNCKADSLKGILEKCSNAKYRFGCTGTLDGLDYNKLVIEGLTGPVKEVVETKELMDRKIVSELDIKCTVLKYPENIRAENKNMKFQEELKFITEYEPRNELITKIVSLIPTDKNILVLTDRIKHIELLVKKFTKLNKTVLVVTGDTPADERKEIRHRAEKENNIVIIATYGVYSTGINIKNLQYLMFATGYKSLIKVLQSIGRGLRLDGKSNTVTLFDIVDDFSYKQRNNYILKHFFERAKIYSSKQFSFKTNNINISNNNQKG